MYVKGKMKKNDGKTPASPLDWGILFSRMRLEYGIIETRAIISSMKLKKVETRNEQIVAFAHVMKENNNVLPSYGVMSKIFDVNKGKIHKINQEQEIKKIIRLIAQH